jgi:hypothetical protein
VTATRALAGRRALWLVAVVALAAAALIALTVAWHTGARLPARDALLFAPSFAGPDQLLTNEFAHSNPGNPGAVTSPDWDVTSGSLFVRNAAGWTGVPDTAAVDATSASGTDSSVFRMISWRRNFRDVTVSLQVRNLRLASPGATAPAAVDGIHLFLRYQNPDWLYAVSLNRRDNQIVIKKKLPGGPTAGGTYVTLGSTRYVVPYGVWQSFTVRISSGRGGSAKISVGVGAREMLAVSDRGSGGPAITSAGAVGLRGDYCEFEFRNFRVQRVTTAR